MGHIFGLKKDSSTTCFWTKDFFGSIFFGLKNVWIWHFFGMKIFGPNFLGTYIKLTYPPDMFLLNSNKNAMTKQKNIVSDPSLITECSLHQGCFRTS